jgi:hypothetical protein
MAMSFIKEGIKVLSISVPIAWALSLIIVYLL